MVTPRGNKENEIMQGKMHADEEDHARPGWTISRRGQDSRWKSHSKWQKKSRKYVHGVANPVIEDGKEQNRTGLQLSDSHPIAKRVTVSKVRSIWHWDEMTGSQDRQVKAGHYGWKASQPGQWSLGVCDGWSQQFFYLASEDWLIAKQNITI